MSENTLLRNFREAFLVALILTAVVFILQWNYGYSLGDEGLQWYLSQRVQFGEMAIRDFFGYDPGRYLWSAAWFKLLGSDGLFEQRLANACFGLLGLTSIYAALTASGMRRSVRLMLAVLLAITLGFPLHKIYEQSLSLVGVSVVAYSLFKPAQPSRWILPGLVTGLAAIIGRNSGFYIAVGSLLGLLLVWKLAGRKIAFESLVRFSAGVIGGYLPILLWFLLDPAFRHAMIESVLFTPYWQIRAPIPFPWRVKPNFSDTYGIQATAISWLCLAVCLVYIAGGVKLIRDVANDSTSRNFRRYALAAAALFVGLPFLYQSFDRADFGHIAQGILPVFVFAVALVEITAKWTHALVTAVLITLALLSWIPSEPAAEAVLRSRNGGSVEQYPIDNRKYFLNATEAAILRQTKNLRTACKAGDGQVIAMPYYPGILAYLHVRSPYWELYYLYKRTSEFQRHEISKLESYGTKMAIINPKAAIDGRADLRMEATNPVLSRYILSTFSRAKGSPDNLAGFLFLNRNCGTGSAK